MSQKELERSDILVRLSKRELKQKDAATLLGLGVRQVVRLVKQYKSGGLAAITHKGRGKQSNHRIDQKIVDQALDIVRAKYVDFSPALAYEKLAELHGVTFSDETLRKAMIKEGLHTPRTRRKGTVHQLRERRACCGELVQMDGSPHDWFEDRGPRCNLNVAVDDATGIPVLRFSAVETTLGYCELLRTYCQLYGLPRALYVDKHSIFRPTKPENLDTKKPGITDETTGTTQFARAVSELGITLILASTPQAKGRVERLNQTLQNRLVKELRLRNISTIVAANEYLPLFTQQFALRFGVPPRSLVNMHRVIPKGMDLTKILCLKEKRILSKNLTFQHEHRIYQIQTTRSVYALRRTTVLIRTAPGGAVSVWDSKDQSLSFTTIQPVKPTPTASSKEVNGVVDAILERQVDERRNPWESTPAELAVVNCFYKPSGAV